MEEERLARGDEAPLLGVPVALRTTSTTRAR
jgi:hypothetical protein